MSHRSVDLVGIGASGSGRRDMQERVESRLIDVSFPERGHTMIAFLRPPDAPIASAYQDSPVVADYFRHCEEERRRRRGEFGRLIGGPGTVFPNASPHSRQPRTIAVWSYSLSRGAESYGRSSARKCLPCLLRGVRSGR